MQQNYVFCVEFERKMNRNPSSRIDIEGFFKPLLLHQQSVVVSYEFSTLDDDQEKLLELFRSRANIINRTYPKNSPLTVIEQELIELFNKFLYEWPDGIWMHYDKKRQNLIENFYYALAYADFKFSVDEIQYIINTWNMCKSNRGSCNNSGFISSIVAFKELKQCLIIKKMGVNRNRNALDKNIEKLHSNGYALESLLNTLLHRQAFEVIKMFYLVYEKQTSYISYRAEATYKKVLERVALDLATGNIEKMEKQIEFLHFLLDHPKVGKNYIVKTQTFKELQRLGAKRVIEIILSKKPFVGALDENGDLMMADINKQQFERFFNSLVTPQVNNRRIIEMDLSCFFPPQEELDANPEYNEMKFFYHLADTRELRPLLVHPVIETLINLKYKKLSIFNWDLILWRVVVLLLVLLNYLLPYTAIHVISWISFGCLLLSELYAYFESPSRIRIFVLGFLNTTTLTFLFFFLYKDCVTNDCPNVTGFGSLLLAINITFILCYLSHHVSLYVFMLFSVARNAFKFIAAISIMLIGFAYCLSKNFGELEGFEYIQTDENNTVVSPNIGHLEKTIFKTFLMLTGELEARDIPYLHLLSYAVFLVFVFFVPIVSINLLSGLAVGDVQQIISNARLWRLTTITMFLYWYEKGLARRTSCQRYIDSARIYYKNIRCMLSSFSLKNIYEYLKISQLSISANKCLYQDFSQSGKITFDLASKRVKLQDKPICRISSHTARHTAETIHEEKNRKRRSREEKKEIKDKEYAKKTAGNILDRLNKIERKMEKLMQLETEFRQISNHIVYLHETSPNRKLSPTKLLQHIKSAQPPHVRRKSL
ncbi:transient receptor potential cation channel protein painless-like [Culicoides brevitarsis]|uniref:transient receptor potential cation channel protein painless-like n=1 Tax=Culicoides brevitarsis TaxID=469753 RepID=UPI00307BFA5D